MACFFKVRIMKAHNRSDCRDLAASRAGCGVGRSFYTSRIQLILRSEVNLDIGLSLVMYMCAVQWNPLQ